MLGFWKPVLVMMSVFAVTLTIIHTESVSSQGGQDQVYSICTCHKKKNYDNTSFLDARSSALAA